MCHPHPTLGLDPESLLSHLCAGGSSPFAAWSERLSCLTSIIEHQWQQAPGLKCCGGKAWVSGWTVLQQFGDMAAGCSEGLAVDSRNTGSSQQTVESMAASNDL
ncbi:hypothetical protein MC885_008947 [Smutsia gigantea]|nr:hypothetical protein MC885_008947 [Smutsia gigantea]